MEDLNIVPAWALVDQWSALQPYASWSVIDDWFTYAKPVLDELRDRLRSLLADWDAALDSLDGDPCRVDWKNFRPLRISREEDWSDWLAHVLETSPVNLAGRLFGNADAQLLSCTREDPTDENERRADLIIKWRGERFTHIEVKVGDSGYAKTFETAMLLEKRRGSWTHFILLLESDRASWLEVAEKPHGDLPQVESRTWTDVAISLRMALREGYGNRRWQAWAYGFCGIVEQQLLDHPYLTSDLDRQFGSIDTIATLGSLVRVMEAARNG